VKISRPFAVRREGKASDNTQHISADTRAEAVRGMVTDWTFKTRPVVSFSHQSEDFRFRFNGANKYQERAWLDGKFWEAEELDYLTAVLPPHPAVIDVGANVGNHAIYFARFLAPSHLRLFEPHPEAVEILKDNLKLNGVNNVDIEEAAVSKTLGRGSLTKLKNKGHGAGSLYKNDSGNIVVTTLDQWPDRAIDLVKIDVEGGELDVLLGGKQLLKTSRPHLLVEISDERFCEIKYILSELDYEVGAVFPYFGISNVHFSPRGKKSGR
jgi:FkbM family methyltransferase